MSTIERDPKANFPQISQHGLNSFYALLEIILPATAPHPLIAIPVLILLLLFYLCVAYITYYAQGWYPYSFLNTEHGKKSGIVTGYCFGILVAILVIFGISWFVIWVRKRLSGDKIKRSKYDAGVRAQYPLEDVQGGHEEPKYEGA